MAACSSADDATLTVYSGRTENLVAPLFESFTEETGIEVEVRYGQSADLALLIKQEDTNSPADVFISQSPGAVGLLAGEGLLQPLSADILESVASDYRNSGGLWIGLSGRIRTLVYNTDLVADSDLPASVFALTDGAYAGRVAVAPANGSFQDFVTGMRELHGDETTLTWLTELEANGAATYANNTAIVQAVGRGEIDMGLVNHYYNLRARAEDPGLPTANHFFDDVGSVAIITAAAVTGATDSQSGAEALIRYLLDGEAQSFLSNETFEYPLASGGEAAAGLPSLDAIGATTYDFNNLSGGLARSRELIDASGLEAP